MGYFSRLVLEIEEENTELKIENEKLKQENLKLKKKLHIKGE